jgi:predicted nucleotidyltransferase
MNTFIQVFDATDPDAELYLFGSRVQDSLRGGDIDLLIHSTKIDKIQLRKIKWQLLELLGEQKLDIILSVDLQEPFVRLILPTAIKLKRKH